MSQARTSLDLNLRNTDYVPQGASNLTGLANAFNADRIHLETGGHGELGRSAAPSLQ